MANETFIKGDDVLFSIYDTDDYEPIACITSSTINETVEIDEVQTKCDPGNIVKTPNAYSYEISGDGIYIDEAVDIEKQSHAKLKALLRNKTLVTWKMTTGVTSSNDEYGFAYFTSLELTGESGTNATFTFTLSGTGSIVNVDPNA